METTSGLVAFTYCFTFAIGLALIGLLLIWYRCFYLPEKRMMKNAAKDKEKQDRINWGFEDDILN